MMETDNNPMEPDYLKRSYVSSRIMETMEDDLGGLESLMEQEPVLEGTLSAAILLSEPAEYSTLGDIGPLVDTMDRYQKVVDDLTENYDSMGEEALEEWNIRGVYARYFPENELQELPLLTLEAARPALEGTPEYETLDYQIEVMHQYLVQRDYEPPGSEDYKLPDAA